MRNTAILSMLATVAAGVMSASAQTVIAPVSCALENESSSGNGTTVGPWFDNNPPVRWWDGSGIITNASLIVDGAPIPATWPEHQWGWSATRVARVRDTADAPNTQGNAILTFELSSPAELNGLVLWNHGESKDGATAQGDRAVETAAISYSTNGVDFIDSGDVFTFTREGTTDAPIAAQVKTLATTLSNVTHIRMDCNNFNNSQSILGFSEIRFTGDRPGQPSFLADPVVKANAQTGSDYASESQSMAGSATNAPGDTIYYDKAGGPDWLVVATNGALSGIPDASGTNTFSIRAIAGIYSALGTLQIVVDPLGTPPEFTSDPIIKADGVFEGDYALQSQSLTNNATDLDGDTLAFAKTGGPDWLNVAPDGALSGVCDINETNTFTVTVDDGNGNSDSATLLIYVESPQPVPPDASQLLAHWAMDEGTGSTTADESGNGYDGVIEGATWTNGTGDRATYLQFSGTPDHVNPSLTLPLMTDENDFTWAVWVKKDAAAGGNSVILGNRRDGNNTEFSPRQFIKITPTKFEYHVLSTSGTDFTDPAADTWDHLAVVKTGTNFQSYVNGVADASGTTGGLEFTQAMPFFIGGDANNSAGPEFFVGGIDDVRLYEYALSAAEIAYIMNFSGEVDLSNEITDYFFDPSGTSTLTFEGGAFSAYVIKSTGDLQFDEFTTITPTAATVGSLEGDVITTDSAGEATAEFTETAPAKFYKVESAP